MAKALLSGINPYLPLNDLVQIFIGNYSYFPHPSPYPPFVAIIFIPFSSLSLSNFYITWLCIELVCLAAIACMLTILWKKQLDWVRAAFVFFLLLAWYPVFPELAFGQLSILLTTLLLAALLALRKDHKILAGVIIGLSVAIKMITWPLFIYLLLKKDWRTLVASSFTALGLNLIALWIMGIAPIMDYYLEVTAQVTKYYQAAMINLSLWSVGYRLFQGSISPDFIRYFNTPALIYLPRAAPIVSVGLVITFLIAGLVWALRTKGLETAFAILVCVIVAVSPVSWDHYYVLLIISFTVMWKNLIKRSFPTWDTLIFIIITLLPFLFNDVISNLIVYINGGINLVQARGYQITFASSLLTLLPLVQLIALTILLWRSGVRQSIVEVETGGVKQGEVVLPNEY